MSVIKSNRSRMNGLEYFLMVSLLIVLFQPLTLPSRVEGQIEVQLKKEIPPKEELNPVRNSSRCDSKPNGASNSAAEQSGIVSNGVNTEERWGIQILGIRLSANGYMLDFRFHVIDPEKAKPLIGRHAKPYVIDEASGMKLSVPSKPKVGSLRAKGNEPDRDYFILFSNPNGIAKKGSRVSVMADDFKVEHLIVE